MQIKYKGNADFEIKSKDIDMSLALNIRINDFVLPGPGEYEKSGVILNGIPDQDNTIYTFRLEDMNLCYLNRLRHELNEDELKQVGDVDILFLPLGEDGSLELKNALKVMAKIDPRVVIPMLYSSLDEFRKSEGSIEEDVEVLKIKKSDLPEEERRVVILNQ